MNAARHKLLQKQHNSYEEPCIEYCIRVVSCASTDSPNFVFQLLNSFTVSNTELSSKFGEDKILQSPQAHLGPFYVAVVVVAHTTFIDSLVRSVRADECVRNPEKKSNLNPTSS